MRKIKRAVLCLTVCVLVLSFSACGKENKSNNNEAMYGETVGNLEDNELFAIIETGTSSPILLVTSQVYDDGLGNQAALNCDVYYATGGEVKYIGTIESFGTAYPISYDKTGIYAASGHEVQRFGINEKDGSLILEEGVYEIIDENGNSTYSRKKGNKTEAITEEEYLSVVEQYGKATVVNFGYGASGKYAR